MYVYHDAQDILIVINFPTLTWHVSKSIHSTNRAKKQNVRMLPSTQDPIIIMIMLSIKVFFVVVK